MTDKKITPSEQYSKYEKARILGSRALQIAMGAPFMVKLEQKDLEKLRYNPIEIAKLEFEKGVIPMDVIKQAAAAPRKSEQRKQVQ